MARVIQFIVGHRLKVLIALLLITVAAGTIASRGVFASSLVNLMLGEDPAYAVYKERIRQFANDEAFIVAYQDDDLLSQASLKRLSAAVKRVKKVPDVGLVESILSAQQILAREDTLFVEKYYKAVRERPAQKKQILDKLRGDPLHSGLLVSPDGRHAAVIIELEPADNRPAERGPVVVSEVMAIFEQVGFDPADLHAIGLLATVSEIITQTQFNFTRLFPIVCLALLITLYLMFSRLWPVFITLAVAFVAVVWTAGFAVLLDRNINILVAMIPSVILIVATSDVIHLCSAYMLELRQGSDKQAAIIKSGSEVGTACLMTSATTFVGFVSLSLVPVPAFRQMGLVLGFGVAVALLLAITLTPVLFSYMHKPRPWKIEAAGIQRLVSRFLTGTERFALGRPWTVCTVLGLLLGVSIFGLTRFQIETDFSSRLDASNRIRVDEQYFNQHFCGSNFLEIFLETSQEGGLLDPAIFSSVSNLQNRIQKLPEVDKVVSLVDLIESIDGEMNPERDGPPTWSRELLAQYLLLFDMSGGEDLERLVDFDRKTMRLAARLKENAVRATRATGQKIKELSKASLPREVRVDPSGLNYLFGNFLDEIVAGQRRGLIAAAVVIMLLMMIWMRSVKIGILSMIPNLIPIVTLGGLVGLIWDQVDSDIIAIAIIAIGIGVDDTIHFLVRLRFEAARTDDTIQALERTFYFSGRAIVVTTAIIAVGFAPFALSDYLSINMMGTLIPFTLLVALLADIFLVPVMARLGLIKFGRNSS